MKSKRISQFLESCHPDYLFSFPAKTTKLISVLNGLKEATLGLLVSCGISIFFLDISNFFGDKHKKFQVYGLVFARLIQYRATN